VALDEVLRTAAGLRIRSEEIRQGDSQDYSLQTFHEAASFHSAVVLFITAKQ
jgi:hypothetical protein